MMLGVLSCNTSSHIMFHICLAFSGLLACCLMLIQTFLIVFWLVLPATYGIHLTLLVHLGLPPSIQNLRICISLIQIILDYVPLCVHVCPDSLVSYLLHLLLIPTTLHIFYMYRTEIMDAMVRKELVIMGQLVIYIQDWNYVPNSDEGTSGHGPTSHIQD